MKIAGRQPKIELVSSGGMSHATIRAANSDHPCGSLLRPKALGEMHGRLSRGEPVVAAEMAQKILDATRHVVKMQAECGIDVGNNGEQARESFFTYVKHRMNGFGGQSDRPRFADIWEFPSFLEKIMPIP